MGSYAVRIECIVSGGRYTLGQRGLGGENPFLGSTLLADIGQAAMHCHVLHRAPHQTVRQW